MGDIRIPNTTGQRHYHSDKTKDDSKVRMRQERQNNGKSDNPGCFCCAGAYIAGCYTNIYPIKRQKGGEEMPEGYIILQQDCCWKCFRLGMSRRSQDCYDFVCEINNSTVSPIGVCERFAAFSNKEV